MARIQRNDNVVGINLTNTKGDEETVHVVSPTGQTIVAGSLGGYRCKEIIPLNQPTFDGAKSIVKVAGMPPWGPTVTTSRVQESSAEILALFEEAGLQSNKPKIVPQGLVSKAVNVVRRTLHL